MKKKLESELMSIAHRVLKLKGKADILKMHEEVGLLYEKLSVLKFAEENFNAIKPTIGNTEAFTKSVEEVYNKEQVVAEEAIINEKAEATVEDTAKSVSDILKEIRVVHSLEDHIDQEEDEVTPEVNEAEEALKEDVVITEEKEVVEPTSEDLFVEVEEAPKQEIKEEVVVKEVEEKKTAVTPETIQDFGSLFTGKPEVGSMEKNDFEDLTSGFEDMPTFEPKEDADKRKKSLNDRLKSGGFNVGLNDKIAFINHLFAGDSSDYDRVMSQLNTLTNYAEASELINEMIKPDYNNWDGKEAYEERFMEIVEARFD